MREEGIMQRLIRLCIESKLADYLLRGMTFLIVEVIQED